jgi:hypothetical protein
VNPDGLAGALWRRWKNQDCSPRQERRTAACLTSRTAIHFVPDESAAPDSQLRQSSSAFIALLMVMPFHSARADASVRRSRQGIDVKSGFRKMADTGRDMNLVRFRAVFCKAADAVAKSKVPIDTS